MSEFLSARPVLSSSGGTFGGGSGGGVPRMFSSTHTPRLTGDVLNSRPGDRQNASLAQQPSTVVQFRSERHAPELGAVNIGNAIMLGEPVIEKRVVCGQEDPGRCGPRASRFQTAVPSHAGNSSAVRRPSWDRTFRTGALAGKFRRYSNWAAKFFTSASDRGSASMRRTCCSSTVGLLSLPCPASRSVRRRGCCSTGKTINAKPTPGQ